MKIPKYKNIGLLLNKIFNPTSTAILKWKSHPSVLPVFSVHVNEATFSFTPTESKNIENEIRI